VLTANRAANKSASCQDKNDITTPESSSEVVVIVLSLILTVTFIAFVIAIGCLVTRHQQQLAVVRYQVAVYGKTKNSLGFGFRKTELFKNLTSVQVVSCRNCVQSAAPIESDKNNFTCIHCIDKERFKTLSKTEFSLYRFWNVITLLVVIVVNDVSAINLLINYYVSSK